MRFYAVLLVLALPCGLSAQAPIVLTVTSPYTQDARFSRGGIVRITGANLTAAAPTAVTVGGIKAYVAAQDPDDPFELDVLLPANLPLGANNLVVTTSSGSSAPYPLSVNRYSLEFSYPWFQRQAKTGGQPAAPVHDCFVGQDTAEPDETMTAYAVGLGAPGTEAPGILVGGQEARVLDYESAPGQAGVYSVTFRVPPGDGILPVVLKMDKETSHPLLLPVGAVKGWSTLGLHLTAPGSLVIARSCGPNLEALGEPFRADPAHPTASLGGVAVTIKDAAGVERAAPILQVECCMVSFQVPAGTAPGLASVTARNSWGSIVGYLDVRAVAPVFPLAAGATEGQPNLSGYVVRVRNGVQTVERAAALLPRVGQYGFHIDLGPDADDVYLVLLGTGVRNRGALRSVTALIDDVEVPVLYAGPQAEVAGLDQVNLKLPRTLAGRGTAALQIAVDGVPNRGPAGSLIYLEFR